jgi:NAD(P)-dependent dehydrogenase (short-subunit alcohol dehydrogenase family)
MTIDLSGRVIAVIGNGDDFHRAVAVQCAEAGADIALATVHSSEEFAVNSIANEIWTIGREHFVRMMDAAEPTDIVAFADECWDRLKRCDALAWTYSKPTSVPVEELALHEWQEIFRENLDAPYLAAQAFGRLFERSGGGRVLFAMSEPPGTDPAYRASHAALHSLSDDLNARWSDHSVKVGVIDANVDAIFAALD